MKTPTRSTVDRSKSAPIALLFTLAVLILVGGAAFGVYCAIEGVGFAVLGSTIPGSVFGIVLMFLGVRYLLSVRNLRAEVYKDTSRFSWENFRSDKTRQRR
jgi:hypothetical protein